MPSILYGMVADDVWEFLARPDVQARILAGEQFADDGPFRREVAEQAALRLKSDNKLPSLAGQPLLFTARALEQCSGDPAAAYKAGIVTGGTVCDITGGLGMDALAFHRNGMRVTYCERNPTLVRIFGLNCQLNGIDGIEVHNGDGITYLESVPDGAFTWVYCDPDRRSKGKRHVALHACEPDVITYMPLMLRKAGRTCVKVSPALEISEAVRLLPWLTDVHVVSVDGACKEILLVCGPGGAGGNPAVHVTVLRPGTDENIEWHTRFSAAGNASAPAELAEYVLVPDAALIKSRCGDAYTADRGLSLLYRGQNLYTGASVPVGFPGKGYRVVAQWPWHRKQVGNALRKQGVDACTLHVYWHKTDQAAARRLLRIDKASNDIHLFLCYGPGGEKMAILTERITADTDADNDIDEEGTI